MTPVPNVRTELEARWAGLAPDAPAVGAELLDRWAEPQRRYHNLDHLLFVLDRVEELLPAETGAARRTVRLAAWFHDAVYDTRASDNEQRSADVAEDSLVAAGFDAATAARVAELVLMTATHDPVGASGRVLCDADLAILASDEETYEAYANAVRAEYGWVSDEQWCSGRSAVLRELLAKPKLFHTPPMQERESTARANIAAEIAALTTGT